MSKLTTNIWRKEVACKCGCGFNTADYETVVAVQDACDYFAKMLKVDKVVARINSWCRCVKHNKDEKGKPNSWHLKGRALDFSIDNVTAAALYDYLDKKYKGKYCVGLYDNRVHFDTREIEYRY